MEPGRVRAGRVRSGGSGKAGDRREAGEKVQGKEKGPARASGAGEKRERREEAEGQGRGAEPLAERERERPTAEREEEARTRPRASPAPRPPPPEESKQILVLGLDGAGKTSVLHTLASNRVLRSVAPTQGFNAVSIDAGGSLMEFLEIGGSEPFRSSWEMHLSKGLLLIFVVDSADHSRLPEARKYLHQLIEANPVIPLVVFAHKQISALPCWVP
ncbi:PREDICTED: ADP-ribosylation factor-like protein 9 isoform X2 [Chinchilla lanigera]|uniref:ADP-ribosylation factor-like protein 9 isoform X2 n=1 Tax=Chinchilla lanigera TaxID=34839 RepID=UPI0006972C58|nr:PREDICTED: ADP-ribosylation factor-like protein 9 isoform X2 [Chinchilla lanigera]